MAFPWCRERIISIFLLSNSTNIYFCYVLLFMYFYINFFLYINNVIFYSLFYYFVIFLVFIYTLVLSRYFYFLNKICTFLKRQKLLNVFWIKYRYKKIDTRGFSYRQSKCFQVSSMLTFSYA